jgi:hypothetical protein
LARSPLDHLGSLDLDLDPDFDHLGSLATHDAAETRAV